MRSILMTVFLISAFSTQVLAAGYHSKDTTRTVISVNGENSLLAEKRIIGVGNCEANPEMVVAQTSQLEVRYGQSNIIVKIEQPGLFGRFLPKFVPGTLEVSPVKESTVYFDFIGNSEISASVRCESFRSELLKQLKN